MKKQFLTACVAVASMASFNSLADISEYTEGKYRLLYDSANKEMTIFCDGTELFKQAYAEVVYNVLGSDEDITISSKEYPAAVTVTTTTDCFGTGKSYVFAYDNGSATMKQYFNFYPGREDYFICYNTVESNDGTTILQSRRLVPLAATDTYTTPFAASGTSAVRMLWVPFDNDGHGRYHNYSFASMKEEEGISHEVAAAFDGDSRRGLVAGSVDHDKWKSGVQIYGRYNNRLYKFHLLSGLTNATTRDVLPHGKVKGQTVSSARYMVGMFDDWREGMNTFADCCTTVVPKAPWAKGNPVGWSTYGVMQERVNEQGVRDCCDFMTENLADADFFDSDGILSISFDACANDNIPDYYIQKLIDDKLTPENMVLGMYAGPLCSWIWALDSKIDGTGMGGSPEYKVRNAALKVNGEIYQVPSNSSVAMDPTHPAVRLNIEKFMKKWASWGVKYVKADFLNGGIIEGDKWYDPEITTGVMAYNYGMKMMYDIAQENGIYIVEAMSPLFPYQYAHGRRTCCDRFSKIDETEYVMNSISYGWWTDRLYTVNDPDQLVLVGRNNNKVETIGENRARATSGMVTGAYIWGDNFSEKCVHTDPKEADKQGVSVGDPVGWPAESRERALEIMGNKEINDFVRTHTGSFMPVEGNEFTTVLTGSNQQSESLFMKWDDNYLWVAAFGFSKYGNYNKDVKWSRLGVNGAEVTEIKEIWTGENVDFDTEGFKVTVPKMDARVYRVKFEWSAGVDEAMADDVASGSDVAVACRDGVVEVKASGDIASVDVFGVDGRMLGSDRMAVGRLATVAVPACDSVAVVRTTLVSGDSSVSKIILR